MNQWFLVKFLTGLVIIAIAVGTPVANGWWYVMGETRFIRNVYREQLAITPFVLVFLTLYCWSVAAICLVRQPIYAAVFSIAAVLMAPVLVEIFRHLNRTQGWDEDVILTIFCIVFSVLGTLTAWLAVRYDVGYKD